MSDAKTGAKTKPWTAKTMMEVRVSSLEIRLAEMDRRLTRYEDDSLERTERRVAEMEAEQAKPKPVVGPIPDGYVMWDGKAGDIVPAGAVTRFGYGWLRPSCIGYPCRPQDVGSYAVPAPTPEPEVEVTEEDRLETCRHWAARMMAVAGGYTEADWADYRKNYAPGVDHLARMIVRYDVRLPPLSMAEEVDGE